MIIINTTLTPPAAVVIAKALTAYAENADGTAIFSSNFDPFTYRTTITLENSVTIDVRIGEQVKYVGDNTFKGQMRFDDYESALSYVLN